MGINNKVPAIRFEGFSNEWIVKKLENLTEMDFSNGVFNDPQKIGRGYRLINVKDMYSGNGIDVNSLSLIEIDEKEFKKNKVEYGDIFFTRSSLVKEGIAYSNVNLSDHQELTFDGHLIRMRPCKKTTIPLFLAYLFKTSSARTQFILGGKTTTMTTIGQSDIASVEVNIPSIEEQIKIGNYFQQIDALITLHQKKHDKLLNLKKSLLEKMFPKEGKKEPEIRFKGFSGKWEEKALGAITNSFSGGTPQVGNQDYYKGDIPFIRSAEINNDSTELFISDLGLKNSSAKLVTVGCVLYALYGATSGEVGMAKINGAINQAILAITPHSDISSEFIRQWLRKNKEKIIGTYLQGGQGNLSGAIVKSLEVDLPHHEEQTKIGNFFKQLDTLLNQHQAQLKKLNNIKQACLEKMFV